MKPLQLFLLLIVISPLLISAQIDIRYDEYFVDKTIKATSYSAESVNKQ